MIKRRNLRTQCIKLLVLDEADEMLNQGKRDHPRCVFKFTTCVFLKQVFKNRYMTSIATFLLQRK